MLRPLPRRATLHRYPIIKWFAKEARARPYLWSFRLRTMTPTIYVGSVLALLPIYGFQIVLGFAAALLIRGNLPGMIGLQMITNPLTVVAIYPTTYVVGTFLLDLTGSDETVGLIGHTAYALVVGGIVCGLALGLVLDLTYRFFRYEAKKHHWKLPRRKKHTTPTVSSSTEMQSP